jgi:hypothetical protein
MQDTADDGLLPKGLGNSFGFIFALQLRKGRRGDGRSAAGSPKVSNESLTRESEFYVKAIEDAER